MTYREIRQADSRTELDRATWAGPVQLLLTYELIGVGEHISEMIEFGTVFESRPFFTYGVEVAPDTPLATGDFPTAMAGVNEWHVTEDEDERHTRYYLGGRVWFYTVSNSSYRYLFRLSFEGVAVRNTEFYRN